MAHAGQLAQVSELEARRQSLMRIDRLPQHSDSRRGQHASDAIAATSCCVHDVSISTSCDAAGCDLDRQPYGHVSRQYGDSPVRVYSAFGVLGHVRPDYRRAMDEGTALDVLREHHLSASSAREIVGGWAFWTFDVDGEWIARFPRTGQSAVAAERELALLPDLATTLSFRVPQPTLSGRWDDRAFFLYRRIPGRGLAPADATRKVVHVIAQMLAELHAFPVDHAARLLDAGPANTAWWRLFESLWPAIERDALPVMPSDLAGAVTREFDRFVNARLEFPPCLVHNDLGLEHVLYDETAEVPVGIIDFESAWIGDPVIDFVPLRYAVGSGITEQLAQGRDLGADIARRMWFYRWMGSVHAIIYGVQGGVDEERDGGVKELRRRMVAAP